MVYSSWEGSEGLELGRGSPGPRSQCHCYHDNSHLSIGNLERGEEGSQAPESGDLGRN